VVVLEADGQDLMVMNRCVKVGLENWLGNSWHDARSVSRLAGRRKEIGHDHRSVQGRVVTGKPMAREGWVWVTARR
jgi:hypothetical protein